MTSLTSAARAGAAVLTSFTASDNTLGGKLLGTAYGGCDDYSKIFTSIPAAEHMTITIHGSGNEKDAYLQSQLTIKKTGQGARGSFLAPSLSRGPFLSSSTAQKVRY